MIGTRPIRKAPAIGVSLDGISTDPRRFWVPRPRGALYLEIIGGPGTAWRLYEDRGSAWHMIDEGKGFRVTEAGTQIGYQPPSGVIVSRMAPGIRQVDLSVNAAKGRRPTGVADYADK
jgi:hypothetical protein